MRINTNVGAMNAYRNLSQTNKSMQASLEKLSSGLRINRAADDASGLVRSEGLRSEIGGTKQAQRNAEDGISFVQTAEGGLNEVTSILQRMRDLSVTAANSTSDGDAEQAEIDQLVEELGAIGDRTTFNGDDVFQDYSASGTTLEFQVGANGGDANQFEVTANLNIDTAAAGGISGENLEAIDVTTNSGAQDAIETLDSALSSVSSVRSELGATQNRLESTVRNLSVSVENLSAAESRIRDTDMAEQQTEFTRNQILQQAGTSMLAQANQQPQEVLSLLS